MTIVTYSNSVMQSKESTKLTEDAQLRTDIVVIQEVREKGEVTKVRRVGTKNYLDNFLTKAGKKQTRYLR